MKKRNLKEKAIMDNINLHYVVKGMFRGFVNAVHRIIEGRIKYYPEGIESEKVKAFWTAMSKFADAEDREADEKKEGRGQGDLTRDCRDIVCVLAESQQFYRVKFEKAITFLVHELENPKSDWMPESWKEGAEDQKNP